MRRSLRCPRCDHPNLLHIPERETRSAVPMALFCRSGYLRAAQPPGVRTSWICLTCGEVRIGGDVSTLAAAAGDPDGQAPGE
jgi:DNA-directed RNA polymerase subunit RPC12/RpoP